MLTLNNNLEIDINLLSNEEETLLLEKTEGDNPAYKNYLRLLKARPRLAYSSKIEVPDEKIIVRERTKHRYIVPRGLLTLFPSKPFTDNTSKVFIDKPFTLKVELRKYQKEAVDVLTNHKYGILESPTGSGKSVMALAIASKLNQKTLFLVHTKSLLNQTITEVKNKLGIEPGIIGDSKFIIKDFTVGTIQTLNKRNINPNEFGLVIVDECHHVPAKTFLEVSRKLAPYYFYGLSATPYREDGLDWLLYAAIGPILHRISRDKLIENKSIIKTKVIRVNTPFEPSKVFDSFDIASHMNEIVEDPIRNDFLIKYIKEIYKSHPTINSVVFTHRINHANFLYEKLQDLNPILFHGELSTKEQLLNLKRIKNCETNLTIATYSSIGEGFDVPLWDTLFLATPFSSIVKLIQVIGRVSRAAPGKSISYLHDFVDERDSVLFNRFEKRNEAYKALG